jgi:hypothetical protein
MKPGVYALHPLKVSILLELKHTGLPKRKAWQRSSEDQDVFSYLETTDMNRGLFSPSVPSGDPAKERRR